MTTPFCDRYNTYSENIRYVFFYRSFFGRFDFLFINAKRRRKRSIFIVNIFNIDTYSWFSKFQIRISYVKIFETFKDIIIDFIIYLLCFILTVNSRNLNIFVKA